MRVKIVTEVHKVCRKSIAFTKCAIITQAKRRGKLATDCPPFHILKYTERLLTFH